MNNTPYRFVHVGFGNMQCANRIEAILSPGTACARRLVKAAKEAQQFSDLTSGRITKSLIQLENGKVFGCALTARTIVQRMQSADSSALEEGDDSL